jgi:hypothetical protein
MNVLTAVTTAQGAITVNPTAEESNNAPATAEKPQAPRKAARAPRRAPVAPAKGKAGKKATSAKKVPKRAKKANAAEPQARDGSKTAKVLDLLTRPSGATAKELMKVTGWQPHSVRGFLSGTVGKKMGLTVTSTKGEDGERSYSISR